ncbi:DUF1405 domain-containing protein [Paenibacillus dokdonensis]|uniref:DUF1405 domain-containing protein n=1 Tax=Paenibacillus dokdonensis TaxID=2567944 RepID=A0ABU6GU69_9BACL|nr:DUF1405 domain-containing protein [Paenibacillus dokdonensis]MEC0243300.1 DUF1405 domain-containing protein [Paenibacillus dokdonensis]
MSISFFWSRALLTNRFVLWLLFWCNLAGTIYGYMWYGEQMEYTIAHNAIWQVIFVPDSPTASLFFTIGILFLLYPPKSQALKGFSFLMESLAVVTSVKYGIWAVSIIFAGAAQGDHLVWQDWMLVASHLAMAVEALLFVRFFRFGALMLIPAAAWTFLNDIVDYTYGVFPWLPNELQDDLLGVQYFTLGLTVFSVLLAWVFLRLAKRKNI